MADEETVEDLLSMAADEDDPLMFEDRSRRHGQLSKKNRDAIARFVGDGPRAIGVFSHRWYYGDLLAWTVKGCLDREGWSIAAVHGYSAPKPLYKDVQTDYDKRDNCLISGQMLVEKEKVRLVVSIDAQQRGVNYVQAEALLAHQSAVDELIEVIATFPFEHNFYKGKHISLEGSISFISAGERHWDSVILEPGTAQEIRRNTTGFLRRRESWAKYGIPPKRGVILAGEPGTGKTIICKALMSEVKDVTCIVSSPYGMGQDGYVSDLYRLAQDLSPCIVFVEDLDLIGQERSHEMCPSAPPLVALLAEMDGITEKHEIVTVATTNCVESLDRALTERPSRFDRVISIPRPAYELRVALIDRLSQRIPLSEDVKEYLAKRTEGFTPAQVQETVFGMVIAGPDADGEDATLKLTQAEVDAVISEMNVRKTRAIGFNSVAYQCHPESVQQNRRATGFGEATHGRS